MGGLSHLRSVLIVEDDFLLAYDIELALSELGCLKTRKVASARDALQALEDCKFDLATVDIRLADGPCDKLVEALASRGIPFILRDRVRRVRTARGGSALGEQAGDQGATA